MEDLHDYHVLKFAMKDGHVDKVAFQRLAKTVAKIHSATHVSNLSPEEFEQLKADYK